jgi:hypothetical protein
MSEEGGGGGQGGGCLFAAKGEQEDLGRHKRRGWSVWGRDQG